MADRRSTRDPSRVRLQPADAFDLIRWLARSQSDPRKAVAELVQNAIDANARTIAIERRHHVMRPALAGHFRVPAVRGHLLELAGRPDAARAEFAVAARTGRRRATVGT